MKWKRLSVEQQYEIVAKHRRCPTLPRHELALWAQEALNLDKPPSVSTVSRTLHSAAEIEDKQRRGITCNARSAQCPELERALKRYVEECEADERQLSRKLVLQKARQILDTLPNAPKMALSSGWLERFQARCGVRFRCRPYRRRNGTSPRSGATKATASDSRGRGEPAGSRTASSTATTCANTASTRSARGWLASRSVARTVLVTGAESGTGLAFVTHYIQEGWQVIAATRDVSKAEELKSLGPWKLVPLDTGEEQSIEVAAKALEGVVIDLLINNASVLENDSLFASSATDCMRQFQVNALGPFLLTRALLRNFQLAVKTHGCAFVAQITSRMGSISETNSTAALGFRASKSALHMFTKGLSMELLPHKIGCLLLHPGLVDTAMVGSFTAMDAQESVRGMARLIAKASLDDPLEVLHFAKGDIIAW